jgi:hypothetical protein
MNVNVRRATGGLALVFVVSLTSFSLAHSETTYVYAGDLNRLCTADDFAKKSWCEGFISAVIETITNAPVEGIVACIPPLTTLRTGITVTEKWIASHTNESAQAASVVVARALAEAFPCKNGS